MEEVGNFLESYCILTLSYLLLKCQLEYIESDLNVSAFAVIRTVNL